MIFGVWPGVVAADNIDLRPLECPPENRAATLTALRDLQGRADRFYVRCYRHFGSGVADHVGPPRTPERPEVYVGEGRLIDLVACYQSPVADPDGFARFVRQAVRDVADWGGGKVQVGEELNMPAPLDGGSPGCFEALRMGVAAALDERDRLSTNIEIGVNGAGMADPAFWARMAEALGPELRTRLDYIGVDAFPDVFHRIPHERLQAAAAYLIEQFRTVTAEAGIPASTPIHITETGWPTDGDRDEHTQAIVLETDADTILSTAENVTAYEFFGLRDGRTDANWSSRFGLMRDDYTPKPAYQRIRELIAHHCTPARVDT